MFYDQFKKICLLHDTSPTAVIKEIGLSTGSLSNWKKGTLPNGDTIVRLSTYFNITTDYLLTGKEAPTVINANDIIQDKLSVDERSLINTYREMTDEGKSILLDTTKNIWADNRRPKGKSSHSQTKPNIQGELIG